MDWTLLILLVVPTVVHGNPTVTVRTGSGPPVGSDQHPNSVPLSEDTQTTTEVREVVVEEVMMTGVLNPSHYPARRAATVVQHYLNTRYGSPYRWIFLSKVHSGSAEDVAEMRKYQLELTMQEIISNVSGQCSAELLFPGGEGQSAPQVQASCEGLLQSNTTAQEEAFYQQHRASNNMVSGNDIPDSYGHMEPNMKPFWHLGGVASSFIMLRESNESTLYNMAQVANFTQLETEKDQLRFNYHVLLHEMISQEIIHWKLLVTWSPEQGVQVLQTELQPKCHNCEAPPNTTN
ncbi:latexin isoform X1 [Oncorhynchus mykiss]|uniref:Cystatin LXN-type domain-containing protein n=3 Tax=Oncorhynchus mykiss TaxID=8022 RepID=A0A8C7VQQ8_ONCMY|nr:latexin isoform X1 [Oncorhynchus mykiss]